MKSTMLEIICLNFSAESRYLCMQKTCFICMRLIWILLSFISFFFEIIFCVNFLLLFFGWWTEFSWEDVKVDKHRENYLGHSLKAPVGRWQKGKIHGLTAFSRVFIEQSSCIEQFLFVSLDSHLCIIVSLDFYLCINTPLPPLPPLAG